MTAPRGLGQLDIRPERSASWKLAHADRGCWITVEDSPSHLPSFVELLQQQLAGVILAKGRGESEVLRRAVAAVLSRRRVMTVPFSNQHPLTPGLALRGLTDRGES
jgi:hypothetical protein